MKRSRSYSESVVPELIISQLPRNPATVEYLKHPTLDVGTSGRFLPHEFEVTDSDDVFVTVSHAADIGRGSAGVLRLYLPTCNLKPGTVSSTPRHTPVTKLQATSTVASGSEAARQQLFSSPLDKLDGTPVLLPVSASDSPPVPTLGRAIGQRQFVTERHFCRRQLPICLPHIPRVGLTHRDGSPTPYQLDTCLNDICGRQGRMWTVTRLASPDRGVCRRRFFLGCT
jgi:hypothetical protein